MNEIDPGVVRRLTDMHAVYRMLDGAGRLIYIGRTGRAGRFDEHAVKRWFPLITTITLEWHDTLAQAKLAENRAIAAEHPRENRTGKPKVAAQRRQPAVKAAEPAESATAPPPDRDGPGDFLKVFGDDKGLHWAVIADRLAAQLPSRWAGATAASVSAEARSCGIPSVDVRQGRKVTKGCRRADIEIAAASRILGKAVQPWKR